MKIAIDVRLSNNLQSGMGVYVNEILKRIEKIGNNQYVILNYFSGKKNTLQKICDLLYEQYWVQIKVTRILKERGVKVLYSPNPPTSFFTDTVVILTIPDMSFYFDSTMSYLVRKYLFWIYYLSAKKANRITTFSQNSKDDIVKLLRVDPRKIEIIRPAIKDIFKSNIEESETLKVLKKFNITTKYFLSVPGTFISRKNPESLLYAFSALPEGIKTDYKLVFVGNSKHSSYKIFKHKVDELGLSPSVIVTGYITEYELASLYKKAFLLVSTSLYEGFGLPPVEAMASKTPVIIFQNSSLSEIVGNAGIKVNDVKELTRAILSLIGNEKRRQDLIEKGNLQMKLYSWDLSARKIHDLLMKVGNEF